MQRRYEMNEDNGINEINHHSPNTPCPQGSPELSPRLMTKKDAKKYFLRIGLALIALRVLTTGVQQAINHFIFYAISPEVYAELVAGPWYLWALSLAPLYLIALPAFYFVLPKKTELYEAKRMSGGKLLGSAVACVPIMYIGNIVGIIVVAVLSALLGSDPTNGLVSMIGQSPIFVTFLCTVVIAPIGEEFIFRKLLCDRLAPFGELQAVLFSGLAFGLFHGNFNQFFYAAAIGTVFAYVYIKTKNLLYPVLMHMFINFFGSIVAPSVLSEKAMEVLDRMSTAPETVVPSELLVLLPLLAFSAAAGLLFLGGLIVIILSARKIKFEKNTVEPEGGAKKALWANPAIIAAIAVMGATFILYMI